jgi:glycosyltransferase involved in cell wall biosynthesis
LKILWAKANKILPVHSGGDIRSYNIARELAAQHEVTFFSYYDGVPDKEYDSRLQEHFPGAVCVCTGRAQDGSLARGFDYVMRLPRRAPYAVSRFLSPAVQSPLKRWYAAQAFDVAVCDFLDAAVNLPNQLTIPTVLFQHNVESEIWRRHAGNGASPVKKLVYGFEFSKMRRYERDMVRRFPHVIAVSEHDKQLMSEWVSPDRITVVPTGVDTREFYPRPKPAPQAPLVLFVGAMDWEPNVDAVEFFCHEIWPGILAKVPNAHFRIVGRNPSSRVQKLAGDSVEVTGRVPSVVDHLNEADVVVVPLRIGGGTRIKIYEAMAMGKAVVSTLIGAEGLDVHHGEDILLCDEPASFAKSVTSMMQDAIARDRIERAAAKLASNYGWRNIGTKFAEILHSAKAEFQNAPNRAGAPGIQLKEGI